MFAAIVFAVGAGWDEVAPDLDVDAKRVRSNLQLCYKAARAIIYLTKNIIQADEE